MLGIEIDKFGCNPEWITTSKIHGTYSDYFRPTELNDRFSFMAKNQSHLIHKTDLFKRLNSITLQTKNSSVRIAIDYQ